MPSSAPYYPFSYPALPRSPASSSGTSESPSSSSTDDLCAPKATGHSFSKFDPQLSDTPIIPLTTTIPMASAPPTSFYSPQLLTTAKKSSTRIQIAHPYARLVAKKGEVKRRKIWNHALEKSLFSPYEISTLGAPHRRGIYTASLESHIDELHDQLLEIGFWPVPFEELEPYKGLNSKTAKSMVASLQHDASVSKLKLLELERANQDLQVALKQSS